MRPFPHGHGWHWVAKRHSTSGVDTQTLLPAERPDVGVGRQGARQFAVEPQLPYSFAMALIKCSECGRTISDKAQSCVGCGAPVKAKTKSDAGKAFNLVPEPDNRPPPSRRYLMWRALLSTAAFVAGVVWSSAVGSASNSPAAILAGLLVVVGLCGVIVTAIQFPWRRSK
jgi:hypothetical protein